MKTLLQIGLCADTHGKPFPTFESAPDLVIHAGDVYDFGSINHDPAVKIIEAIKATPIVFVRGNHDLDDPLKIMKAGDLSGEVRQFLPPGPAPMGLWLVGIGLGCGTESGGIAIPDECHLRPICARIFEQAQEKMKDGDQCILVTHYPANIPEVDQYQRKDWPKRGFFFDCVRQVAEALRPIVVIQGHTHSLNGKILVSDGLKYAWPGPGGMNMALGFNSEAPQNGYEVELSANRKPRKKKDDGPSLF